MKTRLRLLKQYCESIFLYNSELWTLNKKFENTVDVFQRRLYRKLLQIKWPHIISNIALYNRVEEEPWSEKIRIKRLIWLGHIQRLPAETPARKTYKERLRPVKRPRGGQRSNWINLINKDLKEKNLHPAGSEASFEESSDRRYWRSCILKEQAQS